MASLIKMAPSPQLGYELGDYPCHNCTSGFWGFSGVGYLSGLGDLHGSKAWQHQSNVWEFGKESWEQWRGRSTGFLAQMQNQDIELRTRLGKAMPAADQSVQSSNQLIEGRFGSVEAKIAAMEAII